jgi:hypothetical protein
MAVRLFVSNMDGAIFSFLGGFVQRFLNQDSQLKQQQADELAQEIDRNVWQSLRGKMLK